MVTILAGMKAWGLAALLAATGASGEPAERPGAHDLTLLSAPERGAYLRRARAWHAVDVEAMDVARGPMGPGSLLPGAEVRCRYDPDARPSGKTPKFHCRTADGRSLKVKYGETNGEIYAEVASTRLFWALGFAAEAEYPVRVLCEGCPKDPWRSREPRLPLVTFEHAMIEGHGSYVDIAETGREARWNWKELAQVDEAQGGAARAERDALVLLAAFLQHGDSKEANQKLVCPVQDVTRDDHGNEACREPWLMVHDLGCTFGRSTKLHTATFDSANYREWAAAPLWRDARSCQTRLKGDIFSSTLHDPVVSEAGRRFLAALLSRLSDAQVRSLFEVSRMAERQWDHPSDAPRFNGTTEQWVETFCEKRHQISAGHCPD